ncbi:MAG: carotenoid biosynthesis protein [Sandaracinaceae bacterium]|nr:hypothetical protein [Myxococcales bacterium]
MIAIELISLAIVGTYVVVRARIDPRPPAFLGRLAILMAASWLAENTVIHAYGFYAYSPEWSVFVDRVPLLVIAIWPMVIHSAWDLAERLTSRPDRVPLLAALLVLADASLIEPIAVRAGLWWWTEPGLFEVPPIGILGWALFAWACLFVFHHRRLHTPWALLIAPALTHPMLLALWWALFRWINTDVPPWPVVAVAAGLSLWLAASAHRRRAGANIPLRELVLRIPAAAFFFVLLAMHGKDEPALVAYALTFAPPYLVLTAHAARTARAAAR